MISGATAEFRSDPFSHTTLHHLLSKEVADAALGWMESDAPWKLRVESFYEQWEIHLRDDLLPLSLKPLISNDTVTRLVETMIKPMTREQLKIIEVTAHKLVSGQTIGMHNDFIGAEETHRLLIQLNRDWTDERGGILMLFGSSESIDIRRAVRPIHRSGFAFHISPNSFHAVSKIESGERYTLVYSFRGAAS